MCPRFFSLFLYSFRTKLKIKLRRQLDQSGGISTQNAAEIAGVRIGDRPCELSVVEKIEELETQL
jgi:hypothetical protein